MLYSSCNRIQELKPVTKKCHCEAGAFSRRSNLIVEVGLEFLHSEVTPDPAPSEEHGLRQMLIDVIETLVLSVVLFLAINAISARIKVESISMQPNLYAGDYVIVNKLAYRFGLPKRGDIIVFRYPPDPTQVPYIKRVIGLPGDHVVINNGKVYVNGVELYEPYLTVVTRGNGEWNVPAGSLFVMGDNRNNSSDSRAWGYVPLSDVIGRGEVVYWPPKDWALLHFPAAAAANP